MRPTAGPPEWVGRDEERQALRNALDASCDGRPTISVVVGEAGMGKSTLLRIGTEGRGGLVVAASGDEAETDLDFGVAVQLLAEAPSHRHHQDLRVGVDPFDVGATLLRALGEESASRPVIVVVDDAHLADVPSLKAVTFAARRLRAEPIALVLACRPEGLDRLPPGLLRLADRTGGRLDLKGLDATAVSVLARSTLGRPVSATVADRLRLHTGGNPLHVLALLDELEADTITGHDHLPAPRSYAALVLAKVEACPPRARDLIEGLAVLGLEAPLVDAGAVGAVHEPLQAADEAESRTGLVTLTDRPTGRVLAFRHALARAAVYDDLPARGRASLHLAAASVTRGEESLRHRIAAAPGPDAQLAAVTAAHAAAHSSQGAHNAAASLLLGAASVAADHEERCRHLLAAAHLHLVAGRPLGALLEAVTESPDGAARSFVLGRVALNAGRIDEATRWLERASRQAERDPAGDAIAGPVAETLAVVAVGDLRQDEAITWARRALHAPAATAAATLLCNAYAIDGSFAIAEREMDALLGGPLALPRELDARTGRGIVRLWANDLEGARRDLEQVCAAGVEHGVLHTRVNAGSFLAEVLLRLGSLAEALDTAEATAELTDDADAVWLGPLPHSVAAFALAARGEVGRARAHAAAATDLADALRSAPGRLWSDHAWLRVAEAEEDHGAVVEVGDRMLAAGWDGIPEPIHHWRATYVEGLVAVGRIDDDAAAVAALEAESDRRADPPTTTEACRARGALEVARDQRAAAEEAFARGLELDADTARPLERARLELVAGSARRRWGRRRAAASALAAAGTRLAEAGSPVLLARAERELAACGLSPVKRSTRSRPDALTPQELTVARLVAGGRTNREAAAELVISAKTVEHHLSRIYAKLGVRSRTELAARLLSGEPDLEDARSGAPGDGWPS